MSRRRFELVKVGSGFKVKTESGLAHASLRKGPEDVNGERCDKLIVNNVSHNGRLSTLDGEKFYFTTAT